MKKIKKIFIYLLSLMLCIFIVNNNKKVVNAVTETPYYWYDSASTTLHIRNYGGGSYTANSAAIGSNPSWYNYETRTNCSKVIFDTTIKPAHTYNWFSQFQSLSSIENIGNLDTSEVTNMYAMFYDCGALTSLDLSNFNTSSCTYMANMFRSCDFLTTIIVGAGWNMTGVTATNMFFGCTSLRGGNGTSYTDYYADGDYARIDTATTPGYFTVAPTPPAAPTPAPAAEVSTISELDYVDESCEAVIGPSWHWNNAKGVCEEYTTVNTSTR